jgi:hypothetical protein
MFVRVEVVECGQVDSVGDYRDRSVSPKPPDVLVLRFDKRVQAVGTSKEPSLDQQARDKLSPSPVP